MLVSYKNPNFVGPSPFDWLVKPPQRAHNRAYFEDKDDHYSMTLDVPGVSHDGLVLEVKDRILSLSATRQRGKSEEISSYRWRLPKTADATRIEANLANGVVTLLMHKNALEAPRKIDVKVDGVALAG